jgi:glycerol-3-phosphate dehydrogenase
MVIVGTTDTDYKGDPAEVKTEVEDVEYILEIANNYFPNAKLKVEDILSSYAGVRPLVDDGSSTEGKTSREHTIIYDPRNITFVAGGKYTTYRKIAEDSVESVLSHFSIEDRARYSKSQTLKPLNPYVSSSNLLKIKSKRDMIQKQSQLSDYEVTSLIERHGAEALVMLNKWSHYLERGIWCLEAIQAIETTMCMHLDDFYLRRTPLFLAYKDHGELFRDSIASVFQSYFKWDDEQLALEVKRLDDHINFELGWKNKI